MLFLSIVKDCMIVVIFILICLAYIYTSNMNDSYVKYINTTHTDCKEKHI